jgi:hypothetical protein
LLDGDYKVIKLLLNLKNLYKFKDLYKSPVAFNDHNYNLLSLANSLNLNKFFGAIQKSALLSLSVQYEMLKKKLDKFGLIFDQIYANYKCIYINKQKKLTPFFFTIYYEYGARCFLGSGKRRYYFRKNLLLSI